MQINANNMYNVQVGLTLWKSSGLFAIISYVYLNLWWWVGFHNIYFGSVQNLPPNF